jgi:N-acetylmuramoyl-L-alanine amidase
MPEWKGIVGRGFTAVEFQQYVSGIRLNHWRPQFTVVHNTQKPTLAEWRMKPGEMHMQDLQSYYRDNMHWSAGPHLFIADDLIWVFTSLDTSGIHSPSWNAVSWGVELVGDYDLEPLSAGTRENAAIALVSLHALAGLDPQSLKIHKEDPKTTHTYCPGKNIVKADLIQWTVAGLAQYRLRDGSAAERSV